MTPEELEELKKKVREVNKEEIDKYEKEDKNMEWFHGGLELLKDITFDRLSDVAEFAVCVIRAAGQIGGTRIILIASVLLESLVATPLPFHYWRDIYIAVCNPVKWSENIIQNTNIPTNCYFVDWHAPHSKPVHPIEDETALEIPKTYIAATGVAPSVSGAYFHNPNNGPNLQQI